MAKGNNQNGVYKKPTRGWSSRTNRIVGIAFILFVLVCFIVRAFVSGNPNKNGSDTNTNDTSNSATVTEAQIDNSTESADSNKSIDSTETKYYTFRNESTLESHYEKHGNEFSYNNTNEYQDGANAVINNPNSLHKLEAEDGDDIYYLEETNEFVVVSTDGFIRTYFKPDKGKAYYDKQ